MSPAPPERKQTVLFVPTLDGGGAEKITATLASGLAERGHAINLLTCDADGPSRKYVSNQVAIVNLQKRRLRYSFPHVAAYLWKNKPNSILSVLEHTNLIIVALAKIFSPQTKVVVSVHNVVATTPPRGIAPKIVYHLTKWSLAQADRAVVVSEGIREQVLELFKLNPTQVVTIYNPLDINDITQSSTVSSGNDWLDHGDVPVIIAAGRLVGLKNFQLLLEAFADVRRITPAKLIILGEGEERQNLESSISELGLESDVLLPGYVENPYSWMSKASMFVLSSDTEGLPGALLEALACGIQVVATDCKTGPREILQDGRWGKLTPVGDRRRMAQAIEETLRSKVKIDTRIRAEDFSKDRALDAYADILSMTPISSP